MGKNILRKIKVGATERAPKNRNTGGKKKAKTNTIKKNTERHWEKGYRNKIPLKKQRKKYH